MEGSNKRCPGPDHLTNPSLVIDQSTIPQCIVVVGSLGPIQLPCYYVTADSYCDNDFTVTPSNEIAIRGVIIATLFIVLIWLIAEIILRSIEIKMKQEIAEGKAIQDETLPSKIAQLRTEIELKWTEFAISARIGVRPVPSDSTIPEDESSTNSHYGISPQFVRGGGSGASGFSSPLRPAGINRVARSHKQSSYALHSRDPRVRFNSNAWRRRLKQYNTLRNDKKTSFKTREFLRSFCLYFFYFSIMVITLFLVIKVSPQHISFSEDSSGSIYHVFIGQVSLWRIHSVLDVIVFADILLDFGLFLIASACVRWPRAPVFSRHLQRKIDDLIHHQEPPITPKSAATDSDIGEAEYDIAGYLPTATPTSRHHDDEITNSSDGDTQSLSFVLKQSLAYDCCLMIACHESTITMEKSEAFQNTLRSALVIFPPAHIFICDNGNSAHPTDDTQMVAQSIHPDINYLYVPEGNKTFAFYWCNRYWIPFLTRSQIVPNFTYALIIDDDVPLPADLHIPHEYLRQNSDVKAVHFPITASAAAGDGHPGMLVRCQDIEYKLAAVHKQFQSMMSRCLSCHGAVALWERQAMEEVFFSHDTVFHGEDLMMGLCLLKKRDKSRIISAAQSIVPTYAPTSFSMLFRQRVKSWELTSHRKTLTYISEVVNPRSFFHVPSLILKPYFLQETITILLDWLRIYLLCGLFLRDWIGLLLMTGIFATLMYIQVILFTFLVLRSRKELRPSMGTVLAFPIYRLCGLLFRICALCQNLLVYSHDRTAMKIGKREDEIRDIPPTPPFHVVDWSTVWLPQPMPSISVV